MAKNADFQAAIQKLTSPASSQQIAALQALINADLGASSSDAEKSGPGLFRAAAIANQGVFTNPADIFTDADNTDDFLAHDGPPSILELQRYAAFQLIQLCLEQYRNSDQGKKVITALTSANNFKGILDALSSPDAKQIFGDLTKSYAWNAAVAAPPPPSSSTPISTDYNPLSLWGGALLVAVSETASIIETKPIIEKVEAFSTQIEAILAQVGALATQINNSTVSDDVDKAIGIAVDKLAEMKAKYDELAAYQKEQSKQGSMLARPGNREASRKVDDFVRAASEKLEEARRFIIAQKVKLLVIIAEKKQEVEQLLTDNTPTQQQPLRPLTDITDDRKKASAAVDVITKAVGLIGVEGGDPTDKTAAEAILAQAKAAQSKLDLYFYQQSTADRKVKIDAALTALKSVQVQALPAKPKPTPDDYVKAYREADEQRGVQLDIAEKELEQLKEELSAAEKVLAAQTSPVDPALTAARDAAKLAFDDAEAVVRQMRPLVIANIRMRTNQGLVFDNHHAAEGKVVAKGTSPTGAVVQQGPNPNPVAVAQHGSSRISFAGKRLRDDQVIQFEQHFDAVVASGSGLGQTKAQTACTAVLEQDSQGKVTNVTPDTVQKQLSPQQKAILAAQQAQRLLDNYDPKKGPIHVTGGDPAFAKMVCAMLVAQKGSLVLDIRSHVTGCPSPEKASMFQSQASADAAYIKEMLPSGTEQIVEHARKRSGTVEVVNATQDLRTKVDGLRHAWFGQAAKRAEAEATDLHVDETATVEKGKIVKGP